MTLDGPLRSVDRPPAGANTRRVDGPCARRWAPAGLVVLGLGLTGCGRLLENRAIPLPPAATAAPASATTTPVASPAGDAPPADAEAAPDSLATRPGDDWPRFLGPTGDGVSRETGIVRDWSGGLPLVWQADLGETYGTVAVAAGRCVFADRAGDELRLRCVNAETGAALWTRTVPMAYRDWYGFDGGPRSSPVIDGGRVYLHNVDGTLHCVALADGRPLWSRDLSTDFHVVQNFFGVGGSPLIDGERLLVMVGGSPADQAGLDPGTLDQARPDGSAVVALDKRTGETIWAAGDDLASYAAPTIATVGDARHGLAFCRGGLVDFDPDSGHVRWRFPWRSKIFESVNVATPVVVGTDVFLTETYGPGGVRLTVGEERPAVVWSDADRGRDKSLLCHMNTPIYVGGYLYGSSGRHTGDAELRCVAWADGSVAWAEPGLTRSSLVAIDGHFVCLSETGELRLIAIDPKAYREVAAWTPMRKPAEPNAPGYPPPGAGRDANRRLLAYPAWSAPVVSHGLLYVAGAGRLACFELIPPPPKSS